MNKRAIEYLMILFMMTITVSCIDDNMSDKLFSSKEEKHLKLSSNSIECETYDSYETEIYVNASSSQRWKFTDIPSWITITPTIGTGDATVKITFKLNPDKERSSTIQLNSLDPDWSFKLPLNVSQIQNQKYIIQSVDLGLSVMWANMNLGATTASGQGKYYSWGETAPKKSYLWSDYKYGKSSTNLTRYCTDSSYGSVDNDSVLAGADDAATYNLGSDWRMPTYDEIKELIDSCRWVKTSSFFRIYSNVQGFTDRFIDVPFSGGMKSTSIIYYSYSASSYYSSSSSALWTSSLVSNRNDRAYLLTVNEGNGISADYYDRCIGFQIRPVTEIKESDVTGVTLSRVNMTMGPGEVTMLTPTVSIGERITDLFNATWQSSNENVATVEDGKVKAIGVGAAVITASVGSRSAVCNVSVINPVPEYVDLGLSVRWATFNVGAAVPEGSGYYLAWGETEPKDTYTNDNYKYIDSGTGSILKYNTLESQGVVDNILILEPEDDAAAVNWGGGWITPDWDTFYELIESCDIEETVVNGVSGYRFTSLVQGYESNSIFLPKAGWLTDDIRGSGVYGDYWTSELYSSSSYPIYYDGSDFYLTYRTWGLSVRPVMPFMADELTSLQYEGESSYELGVGGSLGLDVTPKVGSRSVVYDLEWSSTNPDVATVSSNGLVATHSVGNCIITASAGSLSVNVSITVSDAVPEYVDLGLSVLWATYNLGALEATGQGGCYAWGELTPKTMYDWTTYKWGNNTDGFTKYCFDSRYGKDGYVDDLSVLEPADDAARALWGDRWRIPTADEWAELINPKKCTWTWIDNFESSGVAVYKVTSNIPGFENQCIYLPVSGFAYDDYYYFANEARYRSATLSTTGARSSNYTYLNSDTVAQYNYYRCYGYSIRPVKPFDASMFSSFGFNGVTDTVKLNEGAEFILEARAYYSDNRQRSITPDSWSSDNLSVATVSQDGHVTAVAPGTAIITATYSGIDIKCVIDVSDPHQFVDLGLSVFWATNDIGEGGFILNPDDYLGSYYDEGSLFAWGETEEKSDYSWDTYKWAKGSYNTLIKYCSYSPCGFNGFTDGKTTLDPEDDAAHLLWGGEWRMPTEAELLELLYNTDWTYDANMIGVFGDGYSIKSKINGKTISYSCTYSINDLPGGIWSSTVAPYIYMSYYPYQGYAIIIEPDDVRFGAMIRYAPFRIRPVRTSTTWHGITTFTLNYTTLPMEIGQTATITPTIKSGSKDYYYQVSWESSDPSIATVRGGTVTAVSVGTATITATCGDKTETCTVTVT